MMEKTDKKNVGLMNLIKRMHGVVENADIEKHRQSQDHFGALLGNSRDVIVEEIEIPAGGEDGGAIHGEWIYVNRAHMKKYIILYCHGGGYSTGSSLYARTLTTKLAASTSMDVLSFDYRLAPEHPYPAATQDAMAIWNYLMLLGYGARDVMIAGDSAGGNLALSLVLKLKSEGRLLPRGLLLMSPWTDLTSSGKSHVTKAAIDPVLDAAYLEQMIANYAEGQDLKDPYISPLFGNYAGFPPTYIQVGSNEILQDDAVMLYKKLLKANVSVKMDVFKGMWHVFQMSPFKTAYEAMDQNAEFIYDICR
ncbi:MAG: alpha/beta hydrolase [Bacteroidales bacterium]|nr:alpha/beta hydrolase [Bacteroidales bacterium]MCM1415464.1 alpha/beta hydrolase [bacterium]MCM1423401.1 alpha/beta hydrolase [bacterium]